MPRRHDGAEPTKVATLVKTYRLLNDPNAPQWSVRFVSALVVAVILCGTGAAVWFSMTGEPASTPNAFAATTGSSADGRTLVDYVGYLPSSFNAALGFDPERVEQAVRDWEATHPMASVIAKEPKWSGGHVIGYEIRYRA